MARRTLIQADYEQLLELRTGLRRFLHWSEEQARNSGLTPAQHQLLLAVRGNPNPAGPTIGEIADHLLLRHHSAVGLIDRAVDAGLITRRHDEHDGRAVRIQLTARGARLLESLAAAHLEELQRVGLSFGELSTGLGASAGIAPR